MKKQYILPLLIALLLAGGCEKNSLPAEVEKQIEIDFAVANSVVQPMPRGAQTRGAETPTDMEKTINDLYIFLFPQSGGVIKQYIETSISSNSEYALITGTETGVRLLTLTQSQVGTSDVYIVANCSDIKSSLDGVSSAADLDNVLHTITLPEEIVADNLLMVGKSITAHNFIADHQLRTISLTRAMARIDVEVTLGSEYQSNTASDYGYRCIDFGSELWLLEKADPQETDKVVSTESSPEVVWNQVTTYPATGTISKISFSVYLNEYNNNGNATAPVASVEIKMPYNNSGGILPPPEFGDDLFRFNLPAEVKRNTVYQYSLEAGY